MTDFENQLQGLIRQLQSDADGIVSTWGNVGNTLLAYQENQRQLLRKLSKLFGEAEAGIGPMAIPVAAPAPPPPPPPQIHYGAPPHGYPAYQPPQPAPGYPQWNPPQAPQPSPQPQQRPAASLGDILRRIPAG